MKKYLLCPERLRRVPPQFTWVDQGLFRHGRCAHCDSDALALYLFLLTASDSQGLSYYSEPSVSRLLRWEVIRVSGARQQLLQARLIAYQKPLYQVLALVDSPEPSTQRTGTTVSVGEILRQVLGKGGGA